MKRGGRIVKNTASFNINMTLFLYAYQRFLFIGIKPSFVETFVKAIEMRPYNGEGRVLKIFIIISKYYCVSKLS